jgi:type I site-specific restriction endonuclease
MQELVNLNFPEYKFRVRQMESVTEIFDIIRKKFVALTPEEWVRQHAVHYLIKERRIPSGRMNVEVSLQNLRQSQRADIVIFNNTGEAVTIVECKAPTVKITQDAFDQIARYNMTLKASYLFVTNGLTNCCCYIDLRKQQYHFLEEIPDYQTMVQGEPLKF